jgi:hypothetical protein
LIRSLRRTELRRRRVYREAVDFSDAPINYDAAALMAVIDVMPKRLRDEINERGIEQDIYDRLPVEWQMRIEAAMTPNDQMSDADAASVWDD